MIDDALLSRPLAWKDAQFLLREKVEMIPDESDPAGVEMEVVEVAERGTAGSMRQFFVVFRGPADPVYPQRTYRFRHRQLGDYAFLVTPIARTDAGTDYEACFSHAA
ncbi:MAG: hypothetical protein IPP91_05050 [Betaproteobacteria bacterium]|nr:hypothetical protein [Betaproteobacteria bacterium]